jgi:hypothetical protein
MTDHVLRHGALRHFNTQLEQLAVYAGAPQRGLARLILRIANVHTRVQCIQSQNRATIVGGQLKIFDPPPAFAAASITPGRATLATG